MYSKVKKEAFVTSDKFRDKEKTGMRHLSKNNSCLKNRKILNTLNKFSKLISSFECGGYVRNSEYSTQS